MTRPHPDREDILGQATALVQRIELRIDKSRTTFVIGFRHDGSTSCYVGDEPYYQFDTDNALRRAHWRGLILKSESGSLVGLRRQPTAGRVKLVRQPLDPTQIAELFEEQRLLFARLRRAMVDDDFEIVGQVPADVDVADRVHRWLDSLP